jgi:hypothetical protein
VTHDSWPLRRSDALFVIAVVLVALPDPATGWNIGFPSTATKGVFVVAALLAWIRFRVFGRP